MEIVLIPILCGVMVRALLPMTVTKLDPGIFRVLRVLCVKEMSATEPGALQPETVIAAHRGKSERSERNEQNNARNMAEPQSLARLIFMSVALPGAVGAKSRAGLRPAFDWRSPRRRSCGRDALPGGTSWILRCSGTLLDPRLLQAMPSPSSLRAYRSTLLQSHFMRLQVF